MRDPKRIDIVLAALRNAWKSNPDLRLGQLIINAAGDDLYYIEDDTMYCKLNEYYGTGPNKLDAAKIAKNLINSIKGS